MTAASLPPTPPLVVGIGASAGGLEAISKLIAPLDPDMPLAYVVLQHVSPTHKSMLVDILSRETRLRVQRFEDNQTPEAGVIYVVPANTNALIKEGIFHSIKKHIISTRSLHICFLHLGIPYPYLK